MIIEIDQTTMKLEMENLSVLGKAKGSDGANTGVCEVIDEMDDGSVQRILELWTLSLSQQVRLLDRNLCSVPAET